MDTIAVLKSRLLTGVLCTSGILLFFFLGNSFKLVAQNEIRFERISVEDGLSQSSIVSIVQDQYGYLWIATLDGLNRYNGKEFRIYRKEANNLNSLYSNQVRGLLLDSKQNLWITFRDAIAQYDPLTDNFINYPISLPKESSPLVINDIDFVDQSTALLTTNQGLIEFDVTNTTANRSVRYTYFDGIRLSSYFNMEGLGELVVTEKKAFFRFTSTNQWKVLFADSISISATISESNNTVYFQNSRQILKYDLQKNSYSTIDEFPMEDSFNPNQNGLVKLSNGELWVYRNRIEIYDTDDVHKITLSAITQDPNRLSGNLISCIYESKDKVVWVGTNGFGLNKYDPQLSIFKYTGAFRDAPLTLSNNYVNTIYSTDDRQILTGTYSGLDVLNISTNTSKHFQVNDKNNNPAQINRIIEDGNKTIWLLTSKGLMKFNGTIVQHSGIEILDNLNIYAALSGDSGNFILTTDQGMFQWHPEKNKCVKLNDFKSFVIGKVGSQIWIESEFDVRVLNHDGTESIKVFKKSSNDSTQFPQVQIKCFYTDTNGLLWIGTWGNGLILFDALSQRFRTFSESDGLPNSVIYGILEDDSGYLWLSTNKGICVFDPKLKMAIRNFDQKDGLQGNEFNTNAYFKSPSGNFYFGGINGLTYFNPIDAIQIKSIIPKTILTGFFINQLRADLLNDGTVISQYGDQHIVLDWNERNFGFEFAGLGFSYPGRIKLKYKLDDFDTNWNFIEDNTRISYTNVPPGKYTLRVFSSNSFGDWEDKGLTIHIKINGPIWKSPFFILSIIFLITLIILFLHYQRVSRLKKRALNLEKIVNERTLEIQLMNEEIATQNEEILAQNEELSTQSDALVEQNTELTLIRASLEQKVKERTQSLQDSNSKLVDQNAQLEQFSFITAHNIRGPLARIKGLIQLLPKNDLVEMKHLIKSVQHLDDVISDLGTIINIRHGINNVIEQLSVKSVLDQAMQALEADIRKKDAIIDLSYFDDQLIKGIKPYLFSIFYNLLHNALKYSSNIRQPTIRISTSRTFEGIVITFEDNGIGIDMRYAEGKIFNLYQRFHSNIEGKGFGLFLIKTQIEAMGGEIKISSELNKGTVFTLTFETGHPNKL